MKMKTPLYGITIFQKVLRTVIEYLCYASVRAAMCKHINENSYITDSLKSNAVRKSH